MSALRTFIETHGLHTSRISATAGRNDLAVLFHYLGYRSGAEVGVWEGHFSEQLCIANPGARLICVDPWKAYDDYGDPKNVQMRLEKARRKAVGRLAPYGCDLRRLASTAAADTVPDGSLDFVYVDANHGKHYVLADLAAWAPKVRSGGIVAGHDYEVKKHHAHLEVNQAVDEFAQIHKIAPVYVLTKDKSPSFFWVVP